MEKTGRDSPKLSIVPLSEKFFQDAQVSEYNMKYLLRSLDNLKKGRATTPSFYLYNERDGAKIVTRFLNSIDWKSVDVPSGWKEYEFDRLEKKFGAQGGYRPWDELSELFHLYQTRLKPCSPDESVLKEVLALYRSIHCEMRSVDQTLVDLVSSDKIQTRAAGCREFSMKKTDIEAQKRAVADFKSQLYKKFFMYTFSRYYKNKIRLFMPGPFSSMLDQARFVAPFLRGIQNDIEANRSRSKLVQHSDKIGFDKCFDIMTEECENAGVFSDSREKTFIYVQGDFEKMDTTTGPEQYSKLFIPLMAESFRYSKDSAPYTELYESMIATTQMPIASPEGMMIGDHGTGSGMDNTNIGEGCCNDYYQVSHLSILSEKVKEYNASVEYSKRIEYRVVARRVNGDDSSILIVLYDPTPEKITILKELIQQSALEAADRLGFIINDKWRIDTEFGLYCQNAYYVDLNKRKVVWFYPSSLILNSILNPEKEYTRSEWDKDYRDIDIVEKLDNGRFLPYYEQLVKYVDNGLKFPLMGKSEKETKRILSKYERYKALQSLSERFNRQDYDISKSPTINLISRIRSNS